MSNQPLPLKLYLLDINSQNKAILEFFVAGAGREYYTLVNNIDQAEMFITDFDFPDAQQNWNELNLKGKPSLILAMMDPKEPEAEWLRKPMTSGALVDAAKKYMPQVIERRHADDARTQRAMPEPLSHDRIGSRTTKKRSGFFGAKRTGAATATSQEKTSLRAKPLVNTNEGGFITTLERPLEETTTLSQPKRAMEEVARSDGGVVAEGAELIGETASHSDSVHAGNAQVDQHDVDSIVDEEQRAKLAEEELLEQQRLNSPIFSREKLSPEQARVRWQELCGSNPDYSRSELKDIRNTGYNRESHLQGSLIAALRLSEQTHQVIQMKYEPYEFMVTYEESLIISPLDPKSSEYTELCSNAVRPGQINLQIMDSERSREIQDRLRDHRNEAYELESFIWTTCLVSSQGRLPTNFDYKNQYLLKHWPNFTRMENFPFAMKIAAIWHYEPHELHKVAEKLEIPQRYIIAFFNAAMGLSLFEQDPDKVQSKLIESPKKKRSGIIARLFSRLAGGMSNT